MKFSDLILHPKDHAILRTYVDGSSTGALALRAPEGFGKATIARALAREITRAREELHITIATEEKSSSITIDQIRALKKFFNLRTYDKSLRRVAIIESADKMTIEAQNSLLKILEEPPEGVFFVLTVDNLNLLLPTILSRVHVLSLRSPQTSDMHMYLKKHGLSSDAIQIADGLPGLSISLARGEDTTLTQAITDAKNYVSMSTFERIKSVDSLSKNPESFARLLRGLKIISKAASESNATQGKSTQTWQRILRQVLTSEKYLAQNVSTKLVALNLALTS